MTSQPYRPSNGTEGEVFYALQCQGCIHDAGYRDDPHEGNGCAILAAAVAFNIDHPEYPAEWVIDERKLAEGRVPFGRCTAFQDDTTEGWPGIVHDLRQVELFA